jgi:hypothetical protein
VVVVKFTKRKCLVLVDFIEKRSGLLAFPMVSFVQLLMQKEISVVADWRITLTNLLLVRTFFSFNPFPLLSNPSPLLLFCLCSVVVCLSPPSSFPFFVVFIASSHFLFSFLLSSGTRAGGFSDAQGDIFFFTIFVSESLFRELSSLLTNLCLQTPSGQKSASSFGPSREPCGFGYLPLISKFIPDNFTFLEKMFVPTLEDIRDSTPLNLSGELPNFSALTEECTNGVTTSTMSAIEQYQFRLNGRTSLSTRHLEVGIATGASYNDIHLDMGGFFPAECENKGAEASH